MKNFYLFLVVLFIAEIALGQQNESDGFVANSISTPSPISGEIFRFQPGVVTQLDQGSTFSTSNRFFTLGRFVQGVQTSYGLNFVNHGKGLAMGYNPLINLNPQIVWKGDGISNLGDLEFRYASTFTPGGAKLTATMRNDGSTVFGTQPNISQFNGVTVGVYSENIYGLKVYMPDSENPETYAGYFLAEAPVLTNFGVVGRAENAEERNFGVHGSVWGSSVSTNYAIYGTVYSQVDEYAGFFDGDVTVTGTFTNPSDKRLKENIEPEENALEQIEKLKPVAFQFKSTDKVNLPKGLQHGFIAQDLEKVFPELVKDITKPVFNEKGEITGNTTFKSVNYIGMISILAQSVKELNAEVDRLKKEVSKTPQTYVVLNNALSEQEIENLEGKVYSLEQNNPNPFNKQTIISYKVPKNDKSAVIMIFDMTGNLLKKYELNKPEGSIIITSSELHQGIFLYSLVSQGREIITKKMIVE